jgi:hypothetical protein
MKRSSLIPGSLIGAILILFSFRPLLAFKAPTLQRPSPRPTVNDTWNDLICFVYPPLCIPPIKDPPLPAPKPIQAPKGELAPDVPDEEPVR